MAAPPAIHSSVNRAPVKAIAGVVLGDVSGAAGVVVEAAVETGVTGSVTVDEQPDDVLHGAEMVAVLAMLPVAPCATLAAKVTVEL
jgi:hypothetical protein